MYKNKIIDKLEESDDRLKSKLYGGNTKMICSINEIEIRTDPRSYNDQNGEIIDGDK